MVNASHLRPGGVVDLDGRIYKIVESVVHSGGGKAGSMVHARLRCLETGAMAERRFNPDDKIADVPVERVRMQFLYSDGGAFAFMNPETFDQVSLPKALFGPAAAYLKENDLVEVEFHEGRAISAHFPPSVEAVVASTGAVMKGVGTPKEAVLENGARVLVPQWIKEGDRIRLEVESGKYLERVMEKK